MLSKEQILNNIKTLAKTQGFYCGLLRNINQDGETVIRNIARDAVQIEDGDHISSERVYDADGKIAEEVRFDMDGNEIPEESEMAEGA